MASLELEWEKTILRRMLAGEDVWREFTGLFGRTIYYELLRMGISSPPDQDDLSQELALHLYRNECYMLRQFLERDTGFSFKAVLRVVIRNLVITRWRKIKLQPPPVDTQEYLPDVRDMFTGRQDENPARQELKELTLQSMFQDATAGSRDDVPFRILCERFIEGERVKDIAQDLQITENAVSLHLKRAVQKMKQLYGSDLMELLDGE